MNRNTTLFVSALGTLVAAGCGGGGGGSAPTTGAPQDLTYASEVALYVLGVDVPTNSPTVTGVVNQWTIEPALPAGLTFDTRTGAIDGAPLQVGPPEDFTVRAANALGTAEVQLRLGVARPPTFAFVAHPEDDTLLMFTVDATTGELQFNGYTPVPSGQSRPAEVLVHAGGRFVFVASEGSGLIQPKVGVYEISSATGCLAPRSSVNVDEGPHELVCDPAGEFLYVLSMNAGTIAAFEVDGDTGQLTAAGMPLATGLAPTSLAMTPSGRHVYVTNRGSRSISIFRVNQAGKLVAETPERSVARVPTRVTTSTDGKHAFVLFEEDALVYPYSIDAPTGELTAASGARTGSVPVALATHPAGRLLFTANSGDDSVTAFELDSSGALVRTSRTQLTTTPASISFDASGQYAYVVGRDSNQVETFRVDLNTGALASEGISRTRGGPTSLGLATGDTAVHMLAGFLFVANTASRDLTRYGVNEADGSLIELGPPVVVGHEPREVAVDPLGRFAFAADLTGRLVLSLSIDPATGALSSNGAPTLLPGRPRGLAVDPSARYLFVSMRDADFVISFAIDADTGTLTQLDQRSAGENPHSVSVDPTGRFVYVTNALSNDITSFAIEDGMFVGPSQTATGPGTPLKLRFAPGGERAFAALMDSDHLVPYDVDPYDGSLTPLPPGRAAANRPTSIVIHPSGRFAFAAIHGVGGDPGRVSAYVLDEENAHLDDETQYFFGINPQDVVVEPSGRFLYVANEGGDDVSVFAIDGATGNLEHRLQVPAGVNPRGIAFTTRLAPTARP